MEGVVEDVLEPTFPVWVRVIGCVAGLSAGMLLGWGPSLVLPGGWYWAAGGGALGLLLAVGFFVPPPSGRTSGID